MHHCGHFQKIPALRKPGQPSTPVPDDTVGEANLSNPYTAEDAPVQTGAPRGRPRPIRPVPPRGPLMTFRADEPAPGTDDLGLGTDQWLSVREAARRAAVDPRTIRRWADTGRIRARWTPGGHRQISLNGLGTAYSSAGRHPAREAVDLDPVVEIPRWANQSALWALWQPTRRQSDDELCELRIDIDACRRAVAAIEIAISAELRRRDDAATSSDDDWPGTY